MTSIGFGTGVLVGIAVGVLLGMALARFRRALADLRGARKMVHDQMRATAAQARSALILMAAGGLTVAVAYLALTKGS